MCDVERAILDAWATIGPRFATTPNDLPLRLARRRRSSLTRPPRAWCLAIRASDSRLPCPERAQRVEGPIPITLTRCDIARLCAPVTLDVRHTLAEAAKKLGVSKNGLLSARVAGVFEHRYLEGFEGRWGKPRPLIHTHQLLDPAARGFVAPGPVWSDTAQSLVDRLPRDLPPQTLVRVPHFVPRGHGHRDTSGLHPEHPAVDLQPPRKRKSLALPPPPPDPLAWYMWKGDVWMGYDWRNPYSKKNYERHQRAKELARAAAKERRRSGRHGPAPGRGSLDFRGHRWLCPHCGRSVNVLFLPLPPINLLARALPPLRKFDTSHPIGWRQKDEGGRTIGKDEGGRMKDEKGGRGGGCGSPSFPSSFSLHPSSFPSFACQRCHNVRYVSGCKKSAWGEIVAYLSGGLLYGNEVKRPAWFTPGRKIAYAPRPTRPPSLRREQIEAGLLAGKDMKSIALALGLSKGTVIWYAQQIYPRHGVRCLKELLAKYRLPPRPHMRGKALGKRGAGRVRQRKPARTDEPAPNNEPAVLRTRR